MSKRRRVGDFVLVTYRTGADSYLCQIDEPNAKPGHGSETIGPCINHELFKLGRKVYLNDGKTLGCDDPGCREWPDLKVIKAFGTDRQHYNEKDYLYHVPECQMEDASEKSADT